MNSRKSKSKNWVFEYDPETVDEMAKVIRDGLTGETEKKGVQSFFYPPSEDTILDGELAVQIKINITWKTREVCLYVKSRDKPTVKKTSSSFIGYVESVKPHANGYAVSFKDYTGAKDASKKIILKKVAR